MHQKSQKRILNNKGSILQIVLVVFLVVMFAITVSLSVMKGNIGNYHKIQLMMKQKNLEIMLIAYYLDQMENDILMSDDYEQDGYIVNCLVDDLGTYYEVTTHIESKDMNYSFLTQITTDHYEVIKFEYEEE